ncbi:MAG TPA: DUF2842 domain-containing protein [Rhizomicrobium sp.]|nr:DUF2842 domain-containing protein [Rhizomicrobium sp.]
MSPRVKKLIGAILILLWIPIYAFLAIGIAAHLLPHASGVTAFVFYAAAGLLWAVPIGLMFPWMFREPKARN